MKIVRLVGLVLVVISAVGITAASTSLASSPEFKVLPVVKTFTSVGKVSTAKGPSISATCESYRATGEITSMYTLGKILVTYKGCSVQTGSCTAKLSSITGKPGEIVTRMLKGELGTVKTSEAATGVGMLFTPATGKGFVTFAKNACTAEAIGNGSAAGEAAPVNKLQNTGKLVMALAAPGSDEEKIRQITILGKTVVPELETFGTGASYSLDQDEESEEPVEVS